MSGSPTIATAGDSRGFISKYGAFFWCYVLPVTLLWAALAFFQVVPPNRDDLFFIGPAWQLALDGDFTHPWLSLESPPFLARGFYLQPPFYSYVLAAWLKVFGLSTNSLLYFHAACGLAVSLNIGLLFRRFHLQLRYACLLVIA